MEKGKGKSQMDTWGEIFQRVRIAGAGQHPEVGACYIQRTTN